MIPLWRRGMRVQRRRSDWDDGVLPGTHTLYISIEWSPMISGRERGGGERDTLSIMRRIYHRNGTSMR